MGSWEGGNGGKLKEREKWQEKERIGKEWETSGRDWEKWEKSEEECELWEDVDGNERKRR